MRRGAPTNAPVEGHTQKHNIIRVRMRHFRMRGAVAYWQSVAMPTKLDDNSREWRAKQEGGTGLGLGR